MTSNSISLCWLAVLVAPGVGFFKFSSDSSSPLSSSPRSFGDFTFTPWSGFDDLLLRINAILKEQKHKHISKILLLLVLYLLLHLLNSSYLRVLGYPWTWPSFQLDVVACTCCYLCLACTFTLLACIWLYLDMFVDLDISQSTQLSILPFFTWLYL